MRYPNDFLTIRKDRFSIRKYSQELFRVILYPLVLSRTIMPRLPTQKDSQGLFGISQKDSVTFLQHNFDSASFHVLRLRPERLALACADNLGLFTLCDQHSRTTDQRKNYFCIPAMHFLHGLFVWTNIYEFMNMYGMRLDHTCHAVDAVTPQRLRNAPRMPKRVSGLTTHEKRFPLFVLFSWFVHLLFTFCSFMVCSRFVLFLFHSL